MPTRARFIIFVGLALGSVFYLTQCTRPSAPEFENPYDPESGIYIPTPDLNTVLITGVRAFEAMSGGQFTNDYGKPVTQKGVCWSKSESESPTVEDDCTNNGEGLDAFESTIPGLEVETQYFVRAYATNAEATVYGGQRSFTTRDGVPSLTTTEPFDIGNTSARTGGTITDDGGASIVERGFCYGMQPNPGFQDNCVSAGSGTGTYQASIEGLNSGTQYFVSAYATTQMGSFFAEELGFVTKFALDISIEGNGEVSLESGFYEPGEVLELSAQPANGWTFFEWSGDASGVINPFNLIMDSDKSITAIFSFNTAVIEVVNPATGRIWMDRNLGASRAAMSSTDTQAHGDLYQWGRLADGHQKRNSPTTTTLSSTDQPGHGSFILSPNSPFDWRSPQNDNLWQGVNGVNNPCPAGFRLPTEAEWDAERNSWNINNASGAFNSPLKLPLAGFRSYSTGSLINVGSFGYYWSASVSGSFARYLYLSSSDAGMYSSDRALGFSVRCIKE